METTIEDKSPSNTKDLLLVISKECKTKSILHSQRSNRLATMNRWLKMFVNGGNIIMGTAGCTTFITQLSIGTYDWSSLVFGVVLLTTGLSGAVVESCQLSTRSSQHDTAADRYQTLKNDIDLMKVVPNNSEDVMTSTFSTRFSAINTDAPFVDESSALSFL